MLRGVDADDLLELSEWVYMDTDSDLYRDVVLPLIDVDEAEDAEKQKLDGGKDEEAEPDDEWVFVSPMLVEGKPVASGEADIEAGSHVHTDVDEEAHPAHALMPFYRPVFSDLPPAPPSPGGVSPFDLPFQGDTFHSPSFGVEINRSILTSFQRLFWSTHGHMFNRPPPDARQPALRIASAPDGEPPQIFDLVPEVTRPSMSQQRPAWLHEFAEPFFPDPSELDDLTECAEQPSHTSRFAPEPVDDERRDVDTVQGRLPDNMRSSQSPHPNDPQPVAVTELVEEPTYTFQPSVDGDAEVASSAVPGRGRGDEAPKAVTIISTSHRQARHLASDLTEMLGVDGCNVRYADDDGIYIVTPPLAEPDPLRLRTEATSKEHEREDDDRLDIIDDFQSLDRFFERLIEESERPLLTDAVVHMPTRAFDSPHSMRHHRSEDSQRQQRECTTIDDNIASARAIASRSVANAMFAMVVMGASRSLLQPMGSRNEIRMSNTLPDEIPTRGWRGAMVSFTPDFRSRIAEFQEEEATSQEQSSYRKREVRRHTRPKHERRRDRGKGKQRERRMGNYQGRRR